MTTVITKDTAKTTRDDIATLIEAYATEQGLSLTRRGVNYGDGKMRLTYTLEGTTAEGDDPAAAAWKRYHAMFDLPLDGLGLTTEWSGSIGRGTIVGLAPNATKYPVLVRRERDGVRYKMTAQHAAMLIRAEAKNASLA
jgi:hypothetical protein